jgi:asparagine synthase (glutamine-hydrolysing)
MCGFISITGSQLEPQEIARLLPVISHRGPDASGTWSSKSGSCAFGHVRLSIIDLSDAGLQPMTTADGRFTIAYNGEIYNYRELRLELESSFPFHTQTDTEVLLAAYARWGADCLHHLVGMFAFAIWDEHKQTLFAARDRFGVKPLFIHVTADGQLLLASEIKALHAAGVTRRPDQITWATYLSAGMYDHSARTFWEDIEQLPAGNCLTWSPGRTHRIHTWYDAAAEALRCGIDSRSDDEAGEELLALLDESVRLRLRSDVPVGVSLSGGLDSSLLLALIHRTQTPEADIKTFTFICGDADYDETPWVEQVLARTGHPSRFCRLRIEDVPALAARVQFYQDEPFGGLPILGLARVHERARDEGVTVLLDGNGIDEGWAGYDYYARAARVDTGTGPLQGTQSLPTRTDCLRPEFAALGEPFLSPTPFGNPLRDLQYRDVRYAKIPRCMRFADRVSMMFSRELREPFLDHRIIELGLRQPLERKIRDGQSKWLPRRVAENLLPEAVRRSPKRALQTPQREWLRGALVPWADDFIEAGLARWGCDWFDADAVRAAWGDYRRTKSDNSFPVWQWLTVGLMSTQDNAQAESFNVI